MVGGYPNEMQTIQWMQNGYILSTSSSFFIYIVAIVILFLVGQRAQRGALAKEIEEVEEDEGYQRLDSEGVVLGSQVRLEMANIDESDRGSELPSARASARDEMKNMKAAFGESALN